MAIITLASATGSPGVTTCAIGLTLAWPRDVILVDADRCASQAVLAGYLNGVASGGRGLTSLAQAYRDGVDLGEDLLSHLLELPESSQRRWFLPGFARPGSARLFEPVWAELGAALDDMDRQGIDVIIDAGRWESSGLPAGLLSRTRCLGLVTRSSLRALAALRLYTPDLALAVSGLAGCHTGLLVVGPSRPYSSGEIAKQFGLPIWGDAPWHPDDAAGLSDGATVKAKADGRALARSFTLTAANMRDCARRWDARVGRVNQLAGAHV